jgi:sigma-E factor negative regulatory protein RseC
METRARVLAVRDGRAHVACDNHAACGACGRAGRCALKWFSGGAGATLEVPARTADQVLLVPGQAVSIAVGDGEVLRAAATVYLPPLAGLLLGAAAGTAFGVAGDVGTLLAAAVGGIAGWGIARVWSRRRPPVVSIKPFDGETA